MMAEKIQVLYVDDEESLLELCKMFLERSGDFAVTIVTNAPEAIRLLEKERYDAIVSDYQMPEMDGIEFLKLVRTRGDKTPFIIFTGKGREEVVIEALNAGADFYIQKGGEPKSQFAELAHKIKKGVEGTEAEDALRKKETRLRTYFNMPLLGIAITSPEKGWLEVNDRICSMLGYTRDELFHKNWAELTHPADLAADVEQFNRAIRGQIEQYSMDKRFIRKDGGVIWTNISVGVVRKTDGNVDYFICFIGDITERKQVEEAIKEREERYREFFTISRDSVFITSPEGQFIDFNDALVEMFGFESRKEMLEVPVHSLYAHPEERSAFTQLIAREGYVKEYPMRLKKKDGTIINTLITTAPVRNPDGSLKMFIGTIRDVTGHKEIEKKLQVSEEKYRILSESSPDHVFSQDNDLRYVYVLNLPLGLKLEDMLGRTDYDFLKKEEADKLTKIKKEVIRTGTAAKYETFLTSKNGENEYFEGTYVPKYDKYGGIDGLIGYFRNITGRKHMEEDLELHSQIVQNMAETVIMIRSSDGVIVYVNPRFERMFGYEQNELIGRHISIVNAPDDKNPQSIANEIISTLAQTGVWSGEVHNIRKDGTTFWCRANVSSFFHHIHGQVWIAVHEDITERKNTDSAFQAIVRSMVGTTGLNSLQKITENVSTWLGAECVMVGEIQPDRQTVRVLSMLLDGKNITDFSYTLKGTPCDNVAEKGFCLYTDNVIQLFPKSKDLVELNIRGYIGTPLRNSDGQVIGILCALFRSPIKTSPSMQEIMDIIAVKAAAEIERTQMLAAFQESEGKYHTIADFTFDWEFWIAPDGKFIYVSPSCEQITGYRSEEFMLDPNLLVTISHPDDRDRVIDHLSHKENVTGETGTLEFRIISRSGKERWISHKCQPVYGHNGEYRGNRGSNRDITERKQAEEALKMARKKLGLLSGITRHDINNQITVILGYLGLLKDMQPDPALNVYIQKITAAVERISDRIQFTKEYEQLGVNDPVWQDIGKISKMAAADLLPERVSLIVNTGSCEIFADPMLMLVLYNLFENAIRHGVHVTTISVHFTEKDTSGTLIVEDNGIGIPAPLKEKIFQRGFGKNTGLGLFMIREILGITGISIKETGTEGKGARFEIHLPPGTWRKGSG